MPEEPTGRERDELDARRTRLESLRERGLEPFDAQDRVIRDGRPGGAPQRGEREISVERVTRETAAEWAAFLQHVYRLDTGPWLELLIDRPGWHEYVAREGGEIVGARGMFIGPDGAAWMGMDGPVPGVMTDDYEPDAPYGVKGVGEPPTVVSTAAVLSALRDATGRELTRVPVRFDDVVGLA